MKIYRWKHQNLKQHLLGFLQGFAEIADGLVTLLSLGFYASNFEMTLSRYRCYSSIQDRKKAKLNQK